MRSSILVPSLLWAVAQGKMIEVPRALIQGGIKAREAEQCMIYTVVEYESPASYSTCLEVNTVLTIPGCGCITTVTTAPCCIETAFTVTSTSTVTATTTEIDITTVAPIVVSPTPTSSSTTLSTSISVTASLPSSFSSSTVPSACTPIPAPGAVDTPYCLQCCEWEQAEEDDTCESLEEEYNISQDLFDSLNPGIFCGLGSEGYPTKKRSVDQDEYGITGGNYYCVAGTPNSDTCTAAKAASKETPCNSIDHCLCGVDVDGNNVCYYDPAQWGPYTGGYNGVENGGGNDKRQDFGGIQSALAGFGNVINGGVKNAGSQATSTHIYGPPVAPTSVAISAGGNSNSGYVTIDVNGQQTQVFDYSPWACEYTADCKQDNRYWTEDLACVATAVYPDPICVDTRACLDGSVSQGTNSWTLDLGYGQNSFGLAAYGYNATST